MGCKLFFLGLAAIDVSVLNLLSIVGLAVLVGLAWLMSSDRRQIDWRLVIVGVLLQLAVAAVLFNSQSWTFPQRFDDVRVLEDLESLGSERPESLPTLDDYAKQLGNATGGSFQTLAELRQAIDSGTVSAERIDAAIQNTQLWVARFPNGVLFYGVDKFFNAIKKWVESGTSFVFTMHPSTGDSHDPLLLLKCFAFGVIPTVIFFGSLMSVLYYLGIMRWVVQGMAWVMQKLMGTSGAESLAAAANVIIGQTEAPLVVRPFLSKMTRSELNCLMLGGFATITGSLMAVFASIGISAGHLLTASIISAPAALVIAKILQPETERPITTGTVKMPQENVAVNVIDAAAQGASDGMKLAINVIAMLIAFLALIALLDAILGGLGELAQGIINTARGSAVQPIDLHWSIGGLFALLFYPLAWIMGIEVSDCAISGEILGTKMVVNEFVAYFQMGGIVNDMKELGANAEVSLSPRTQVILTYALCGFSNFSSIGIQIGGIGALVPERRGELAQLGLRAMLGGMIACCMTACIAGMLHGVL